ARFLEQLGASRGAAAPPVSNGCDGQPGTPAEAVGREHEASHEPVRAELEPHRARGPSPRGPRGGVASRAHGPGAEAALTEAVRRLQTQLARLRRALANN